MPELPEVETVRKGLEKLLNDFYIERIEVLKERSIASNGGSKSFIDNVKNSYLGNWERRGKYLIGALLTKEKFSKIVHMLRPCDRRQNLVNKALLGKFWRSFD